MKKTGFLGLFFVVFLLLSSLASAGAPLCRALLSNQATGEHKLDVDGLEQLRKQIADSGVAIVLGDSSSAVKLTPAELRYLTGVPTILGGSQKLPKNFPGVVLHIGSTELRKVGMGRVNPILNPMKQVRNFENKLYEAKLLTEHAPDSYPKSYFLEKENFGVLAAKNLNRQVVYQRIQNLFDRMNLIFPSGFIVKHAYEFKSGDSKTGPVLSTKVGPKELTEHFFRKLPHVKKAADNLGLKWWSKNLERKVMTTEWDPYFAFVYALLRSPEKLMAQERLEISEEFRADFINGKVINIQPRYGHYENSPQANGASQFLNQLFQQLSDFSINFAGGADIVYSKNTGKFKVIELNLGGESAYIDPLYLPVSANKYLSGILGHPTPLIQDLNYMKTRPVAERIQFIRDFKRHYLDSLENLGSSQKRDAVDEFADYLNVDLEGI